MEAKYLRFLEGPLKGTVKLVLQQIEYNRSWQFTGDGYLYMVELLPSEFDLIKDDSLLYKGKVGSAEGHNRTYVHPLLPRDYDNHRHRYRWFTAGVTKEGIICSVHDMQGDSNEDLLSLLPAIEGDV